MRHDMENMQIIVARFYHEIEFLVLVRKYMKEGMELERETMEEIEKRMFKSYETFQLAEEHTFLGHSSLTYKSRMVSDRLSSATTTTTPKKRSW